MGKKLFGLVRYRQRDVIRNILESPEASDVFNELLAKKHQSIEKSKTKAKTILQELTSSYNLNALKISYVLVKSLEKTMFDNISIYGDGLEKARELSKDGKIIFLVPNHKSHVDYLLISYILFMHDIAPPHIAAGVNLSFWPMGPIFRNTGAYFIRRKISGNFLYTKLLEFYFKWMLQNKICQEFYMEGGRSRDGSIRRAQSGIFTLLCEQILRQNLASEVYIVPTSITYDRVPEMESLVHELKGSEKKKENIFSLFSSLSVLWRKHGTVHFHFGTPEQIKLETENGELSKKKIQRLVRHIFEKIQKQKTLTSSGMISTVLLTSAGKISSNDTLQMVLNLIRIAKPCQTCMSDSLANAQKDWLNTLDRHAGYGWFTKSGENLEFKPEQRMELNYYKNDLVPFLVPFSLRAFSKITDDQEIKMIQKIFEHAYHYASHSFLNPPEDMEKFLRDIHRPTLSLYKKILDLNRNQVLDFTSKETYAKLKKGLEADHFPYPEMVTTEAILSSCVFYHHLLGDGHALEEYGHVLQKILASE